MVVVVLLTLAGCSNLNPLSLLTGGGPNVAANTQLGQENEQTVGVRTSNEQTIVRPNARDITQVADETVVKTDKIEGDVTVESVPPWVMLLLIIGWLAPSPNEIGRWVRSLFIRKDKEG